MKQSLRIKKPVTGIVTTSHKFPLNKVKVTSLKSGEVAYTDSIGRFSLNSLDKDVLTFTALGFESRKIKVGKQKTYLVDLLYKDNVANFNDAVKDGHISEDVLRKAISLNDLKKGKDYSTYNSIFELIASEIYDVRVNGTTIYNKKKTFNLIPLPFYFLLIKFFIILFFIPIPSN